MAEENHQRINFCSDRSDFFLFEIWPLRLSDWFTSKKDRVIDDSSPFLYYLWCCLSLSVLARIRVCVVELAMRITLLVGAIWWSNSFLSCIISWCLTLKAVWNLDYFINVYDVTWVYNLHMLHRQQHLYVLLNTLKFACIHKPVYIGHCKCGSFLCIPTKVFFRNLKIDSHLFGGKLLPL